jgi:hypothetical protein
MKSENLNFLEPSEPLQACNGTAAALCKVFLSVFDQKTNVSINITRNPQYKHLRIAVQWEPYCFAPTDSRTDRLA